MTAQCISCTKAQAESFASNENKLYKLQRGPYTRVRVAIVTKRQIKAFGQPLYLVKKIPYDLLFCLQDMREH